MPAVWTVRTSVAMLKIVRYGGFVCVVLFVDCAQPLRSVTSMVESWPSRRSDVKSMVYATDRFEELLPSGNLSFCREAMAEASANVPHSGRFGMDEGRCVTITIAA